MAHHELTRAARTLSEALETVVKAFAQRAKPLRTDGQCKWYIVTHRNAPGLKTLDEALLGTPLYDCLLGDLLFDLLSTELVADELHRIEPGEDGVWPEDDDGDEFQPFRGIRVVYYD